MKVGELLMLSILGHGFFLHYRILGHWSGAQPMALSIILMALSLFMGGLILFIVSHFLRYNEITTLFETDGFIQAASAFILLDLAIATLKFNPPVPNHFFVQLVLVGIYIRLRPKIH